VRPFSLTALAACAALSLCSLSATGQSWPVKPVRWIVPNSGGSGPDAVVRLAAVRLEKILGQPFIIENRPGANFFIASEAVARAQPDGYTIGLGSGVVASVNPHLFKSLPYDPDRDFDWIAMLVDTNWTLIGAHPSIPANNLTEFIALARKNPGKYTYQVTVANNGMWFRWLTKRLGIELLEVEYKSTPQAVQDAIAGRTDLFVNTFATHAEHVRSGKLKALALGSAGTMPGYEHLENVQSFIPNSTLETWIAVFGPAGLPPAMVQRLNGALDRVLKEQDFRTRILGLGWNNVHGVRTPAAVAEHAKSQRARWGEFVREAGVTPQ
jgi:tripartite-type tricarboxylate transporter receptor subunit TctC